MTLSNNSSNGAIQPPRTKAQPGDLKLNSGFSADDEEKIVSPGSRFSQTDDFEEDVDDTEGDVDGFGEDAIEGMFDEEELFDSGQVASLEDLGLSDPSGSNPNNTRLMRAGLPRSLQAPEPRPGYAQRFVRYMTKGGQKDINKIMQAKRLGWIPRRIKPGEFQLPTFKIGNSSIIMIDGLVLCEMPLERKILMTQQQRNQTAWNTKAIESQFKEEGRSGDVPVGYKETIQTKHGTRRPVVAPNRN